METTYDEQQTDENQQIFCADAIHFEPKKQTPKILYMPLTKKQDNRYELESEEKESGLPCITNPVKYRILSKLRSKYIPIENSNDNISLDVDVKGIEKHSKKDIIFKLSSSRTEPCVTSHTKQCVSSRTEPCVTSRTEPCVTSCTEPLKLANKIWRPFLHTWYRKIIIMQRTLIRLPYSKRTNMNNRW